MRNVTSHSVIIAFGYGVAEYTQLASELAQRYPAIYWLSAPHQMSSLAFGVLCLVAVSHVTPWAARGLIITGNVMLTVRGTCVSLWVRTFQRIETGLIRGAKAILWKLLEWLEGLSRNPR